MQIRYNKLTRQVLEFSNDPIVAHEHEGIYLVRSLKGIDPARPWWVRLSHSGHPVGLAPDPPLTRELSSITLPVEPAPAPAPSPSPTPTPTVPVAKQTISTVPDNIYHTNDHEEVLRLKLLRNIPPSVDRVLNVATDALDWEGFLKGFGAEVVTPDLNGIDPELYLTTKSPEDSSYDVVWAWKTLDAVKLPHLWVRLFHQTLRDGGILIGSVAYSSTPYRDGFFSDDEIGQLIMSEFDKCIVKETEIGIVFWARKEVS